ncbi:MAG: hypothetical protein HYU36_03350 [Planctomycetes bacterium]|nr:hypothetical protein [Planctomycetota bacterium]
MPSSESKRIHWAVVWCLSPLFVALALYGIGRLWRNSFLGRIEEQLAQVREQGFPSSLKELNSWYPQPAGENAADLYGRALFNLHPPASELQKGPPPQLSRPLIPGEQLSEEVRKAIEEWLLANRESLEHLRRAAAVRECRYPIDLTRGFQTPLSHLQGLQQASRLLYHETVYHAERGERQEAILSFVTHLSLARSLNDEPVLLSYLIQGAIRNFCFRSLERILSHVELSEEELLRLAAEFEGARNPDGLLRAMAAERCSGAALFLGLMDGTADETTVGPLGITLPWSILPVNLFVADNLLLYLDLMDQNVQACRLPAREKLAQFKKIEVQVQNLSKYRFLLQIFFPALSRCALDDLRDEVQCHIVRVALAVERYRLIHGKLPDSLSALTPDFLESIPGDPFAPSGPLSYGLKKVGYVLYSVGEYGNNSGDNPPIEATERWWAFKDTLVIFRVAR